MNRQLNYLTTLIIICSLAGQLSAKTWNVNSGNSFINAHYSAASGDSIVWAEGVYFDVYMGISKSNLYIMAGTPGKTIFTGNSRVLISCSHNIL